MIWFVDVGSECPYMNLQFTDFVNGCFSLDGISGMYDYTQVTQKAKLF